MCCHLWGAVFGAGDCRRTQGKGGITKGIVSSLGEREGRGKLDHSLIVRCRAGDVNFPVPWATLLALGWRSWAFQVEWAKLPFDPRRGAPPGDARGYSS